jgi:putative Mg2+ transporter-C (MgtC) family protein
LLLRVLVAAALGGLIGFEREFREQSAGFRTHILVSLGATLFTLVGAYGVAAFLSDGTGSVTLDPTRVAAQVVTGIGFLGAGAILRQGVNIRGLTTAATLWVTAAVGTAVALGYYTGAVITTATTLVALIGLKRLEGVIFTRIRQGRHRFVIEVGPQLLLSDLAKVLEAHDAAAETLELSTDEEGNRMLVASLRIPPRASVEDIAQDIGMVQGVMSVDLET